MSARPTDSDASAPIHEARVWSDNGWTATVIKNEDDEGWAVAMTRDGASEPDLVGPWTMGRDKRNPKPLDSAAFITLVKTANEFVRRREQQRDAALHQSVAVAHADERFTIHLDIVPDEDAPYAELTARDAFGEQVAQVRVAPSFKLNRSSAAAWVEGGFAKPGGR